MAGWKKAAYLKKKVFFNQFKKTKQNPFPIFCFSLCFRFQEAKWREIQVGDVVRLKKNDFIPV